MFSSLTQETDSTVRSKHFIMSKHWKPAQSRLETEESAGVPLEELGISTRIIASELDHDPQLNNPLVMPIYQTSTYKVQSVKKYTDIIQQGGFIYQRMGSPNGQDVECRIRALEGGAGTLVFNSGMSCLSTILMGLLKQGDHVIYHNPIYSGTHAYIQKLLPLYGIESTVVEAGCSSYEYEKAIRYNTKLLIGETPSNPLSDVLDVQMFSRVGRKHDVITVVDATYASPCLMQPIKYGIDIVWHSGSKYINGHSDCMAGVLTCRKFEIYSKLQSLRALMGTNIAPSEASLLSRGLKTLIPRMRIHCTNAQGVAEFLHSHNKIGRVYYPGLKSHPGHDIAAQQMEGYGGMVSFEVRGGLDAARQLTENVRLISIALSLGGVETLIQHPATMTHGPMLMSDKERKEAKITDGLVRLSVGIEDLKDLIRDLKMALDSIRVSPKLNGITEQFRNRTKGHMV